MIRFDSSHTIIIAAKDPLRFDPPVRDLLSNIAADPSKYDTVEISHAIHRIGGDKGFVSYISKSLARLIHEAKKTGRDHRVKVHSSKSKDGIRPPLDSND